MNCRKGKLRYRNRIIHTFIPIRNKTYRKNVIRLAVAKIQTELTLRILTWRTLSMQQVIPMTLNWKNTHNSCKSATVKTGSDSNSGGVRRWTQLVYSTLKYLWLITNQPNKGPGLVMSNYSCTGALRGVKWMNTLLMAILRKVVRSSHQMTLVSEPILKIINKILH